MGFSAGQILWFIVKNLSCFFLEHVKIRARLIPSRGTCLHCALGDSRDAALIVECSGGGSGIQGGNTATGTKEPRDGVELGWILVFPNNTMGLLGDVPCFYLPQNLTLRVAEKAIPSFATVRQEMGTENKDFCVPCR